jgi:oligoendopeptidase F
LCSKYYELNKLYFGDSVVIDDEIRYEWERIPHFYYNFYVYKYATGLSAATKIVTDILSGKEKAVDNYLSFLKCGRTKSPLESLKVAGVDLNDKETVRSAIKYFDKIVDDFSELYDKVYNK